jgi:hypothetical protein
MKKEWKGNVISEGLSEPAIVGLLSLQGASISSHGLPIDYKGSMGRQHSYEIKCSRGDIDSLQQYLLPGWHAQFQKGDKMIVVFNNKQFELRRDDKRAMQEVLEYGQKQGIPENVFKF